jgi:carboxymethylenebutenolidase
LIVSTIIIDAADGGAFGASVARPPASKAPVVVMLQEIFGVNQAMRDVATFFASEGFLVVTPDLFWRQQPGVELDPANATDRDLAVGYMKGLNPVSALADCQATIDRARVMDGGNGKVAVVGFCLGGRLAYLLAAKSNADVAVAYYGVGLETLLDLAPAIRAPLLLHIGGADHLCGAEAQAAILNAAAGNAKIESHVYPGASHAFRRPGGESYQADAAALADERTLEFLRKRMA